MEIKYLKNKKINIDKWNDCIHNSFNGIIYAYSWYLDSVCDEWDALISGDYDTVMPLPQKIGSGKKNLYIPLFARQLGVFSTKLIDERVIKNFVKNIPREYKHIEIGFNKFNKITEGSYLISNKKTYELDLIYPYRKIFKNYSLEVRESLIEAYKNKVSITIGLNPNDFMNLVIDDNLLEENDQKSLRLLLTFGIRYKNGNILAAYNNKNELCAVGFFIRSNDKIIFLFSTANKEGMKNKAVYLLVDYFIGSHVEKGITLSFENIALDEQPQIYEGFGAKKYEYNYIAKNSSVWYKNILKRKEK